MGVKPLIRAKTEVQLNYWPYYSSPVYSHAASYDHYKLGSMYQWFLLRTQNSTSTASSLTLPITEKEGKAKERQRKDETRRILMIVLNERKY
ncbi:hypothetical protein niasHT_026103 [Heterodera trifolii]|uniref:Uncharacterized protein n=1 Tax=Heterodera trifolii TaxID=157864 RepID=A0ABD2KS10_9BILA